MTGETTSDAFLGGRITLVQPRRGYRAGIDPVLLAAAIPARPGQAVLDLGCGVGAALFCLGARIPGLDLWGLELQPEYAQLARTNARLAGLTARIETGDIAAPPDTIRQRRFDHVMANPPYFAAGTGPGAADRGRAAARAEQAPLGAWVAAGLRRLMPGGTLTIVQRADRLPDLLAAGPVLGGTVRPVAPRTGRVATLVLAQWRKSGRGAFHLAAPLILHEGDRHERDGNDYRREVEAILRAAAPLPLGN